MPALSSSTPIGVIGAGTMGAGIAQVAAHAGHPVLLFDQEARAMAAAIERIDRSTARAVEKARMSSEQRTALLGRITVCPSLADLAPAGLVVEAIAEDLEAKRRLFRALEKEVSQDAVLTSNTSSLSITALAGGLGRPERILGLHFFNPPPAMALVEVVAGLASAPAVVGTARATVERWGKTPVVLRSSPGFIVNRVARPFYGEALQALSERAADPATIDAVLREAGGFRMGPFELMDLIGLDVNLAVSRSIHHAFHHDPRYAPSLIQEEMTLAGWLGRKSGRGFYAYGEGAAPPEPQTAAPAPPPGRVVLEGSLGPAAPLRERFQEAGVDVEETAGEGVIRAGDAVLARTDGRSATELGRTLGAPVVLFDLALDYGSCTRIALAPADQAGERERAAALGLFQAAGMAVSLIDDVGGMLVMRTVCMLANEALEALHAGIADADAIDRAMRLGVNYPKGPLEWADDIGPARVLQTLDHLAGAYGWDRYRASPLLRRRVAAGGRLASGPGP